MKLIALIASVFFFPISGLAEDWMTTDGKIYQDVKVIRSDAATVTILTQEGEVAIPLTTLPPEIQKRFNHDSAAGSAPPGASGPSAAQQNTARANALKNAVFIDGLVTYKDRDGALLVDCNAPPVPSPSDPQAGLFGRTSSSPVSSYQNTLNATGNADASQGRRAHGTVFLLHASPDIVRGDAVRLTAYPAGQHTDRSGTFHAYSATLP